MLCMKEILADIKARLQANEYINEEHVRLSLVARVLQDLGWNIWNPAEVNAEFVVVPNEDKTKVDLALFLRPPEPSVFIEIKAVGHMQGKLTDIERQMRNYNRDNQAMFTVITDGRNWRFYFSYTGGEFSRRCFETVDLVDDELDDVEASLSAFLRKSEIENENARRKAENYLQLNQIQRTAEDCLPEARRLVTEPPYPTLPQALIQLVQKKGFTITHEDALRFIQQANERKPILNPPPMVNFEPPPANVGLQGHLPGPARELNPDRPENLTHAKIIEGRFGSESAANWNDLIDCAVRTALNKGVPDREVRAIVYLEEGDLHERGFHRIRGTAYSVQGMDARNSWRESLLLARKSNSVILVRFQWRDKEGAAHPGEEGLLKWSP
jgi:hypothetical protein